MSNNNVDYSGVLLLLICFFVFCNLCLSLFHFFLCPSRLTRFPASDPERAPLIGQTQHYMSVPDLRSPVGTDAHASSSSFHSAPCAPPSPTFTGHLSSSRSSLAEPSLISSSPPRDSVVLPGPSPGRATIPDSEPVPEVPLPTFVPAPERIGALGMHNLQPFVPSLPPRLSVANHTLQLRVPYMFVDVEYASTASGPGYGESIAVTLSETPTPLVFPTRLSCGSPALNMDFIALCRNVLSRGGQLALWNPANDFGTLYAHGVRENHILWMDRSQMGSRDPKLSGPQLKATAMALGCPYYSKIALGEVIALKFIYRSWVDNNSLLQL